MTAILQLINLLLPSVANVILMIKNANGTTTAIISSAETATDADIAQIQQWLAAHQQVTVTTTTPAKTTT